MSLPAFNNSYTQLPDRFYARLRPTPVSSPSLIRVNRPLAEYLGIDLDWLESAEGIDFLAGNSVPNGADPLAMVYAGHQFGGWVPQLGDGRALLMGEVVATDRTRYDLQLKGSGPTPYSRMGDGRSPLGPVIREYVVSEAMAALGVPSTRALAAVRSGDPVYRESTLPGGVLTRVAQSHIRVGTFQYFLARQDYEALRLLTGHVISRHFPDAGDSDNPVLELLVQVISRQAELIAKWQALGFIHGVMNTDNMLVSGHTIDYGPCAFMDTYHPGTVFSSIDSRGRYAYANQPGIAQWNLACFAQCLLPQLHDDEDRALELAQHAIDSFPNRFKQNYQELMCRKLGLGPVHGSDPELVDDLLALMEAERTDFTLAFRRLSDLVPKIHARSQTSVAELISLPRAYDSWLSRWHKRLESEKRSPQDTQTLMYSVNPVFIPRNHLVEEAISQAVNGEDDSSFHRLVEVLSRPFAYDPNLARYATPPTPDQVVRRTFCGT